MTGDCDGIPRWDMVKTWQSWFLVAQRQDPLGVWQVEVVFSVFAIQQTTPQWGTMDRECRYRHRLGADCDPIPLRRDTTASGCRDRAGRRATLCDPGGVWRVEGVLKGRIRVIPFGLGTVAADRWLSFTDELS